MNYIVMIGREPAISLTEILCVAKSYHIEIHVEWIYESLVCLKVDSPVDFISTTVLGGILKVIEPISYIDSIASSIVQFLVNHTEHKKIIFTLQSSARDSETVKLPIEIKKQLATHGRSARFIASNQTNNAATLLRNQIIQKGGEFHIINRGETIILGRTIDVQNIDAWTERDINKPARDAKLGMLPPKLARSMLNLSGVHQNNTVLDPFCGTGTVLLEALTLGINCIGSDANPVSCEASRTNTSWFQKKYSSPQSVTILQADARDIARRINQTVDAIVTEPYLGNVKTLTYNQRMAEAHSLADLYVNSLLNWKKILHVGAKVVMAIPLFVTRVGKISIPIHNRIEKIGFKIVPPPAIATSMKDELSPHGNILYGRENQRVMREILVLEKS